MSTGTQPTVFFHQPTLPAFVLGSTQADDVVDAGAAESAGWEVCRRRSGGGLVVLSPTNSLWIDVFIPPTDSRWSDDVGRAFDWLGQLWGEVVARLAPEATVQVHRGAPVNRPAGQLLCFAGVGQGEVLVNGHKVVGLSQRRSRAGARFQSLLLLSWDPAPAIEFGSPLLRALVDNAQLIGWPPGLEVPSIPAASQTFLDVLAEFD